jgi:hypothetical protein
MERAGFRNKNKPAKTPPAEINIKTAETRDILEVNGGSDLKFLRIRL